MSPLKFNFDSEEELCIWKDDDEPIAFVSDDVNKLMQVLYNIITEESDEVTFHRKKYGTVKLEYSNSQVKIYGKKGYYLVSKNDLQRLISYLVECINERKILLTDDEIPNKNIIDRFLKFIDELGS